jgi:DME family drug/metabolite transporter
VDRSGDEAISPSAKSNGRRLVLAAAVLWSLAGVLAKLLTLDGPSIAFYRGLFAGLVLLPFVPRSRWVIRPALLPLGLVFGAMTGFYLAAVKATTAANAIFLQCSSTFWTIPLSALILRERPDRRSAMGIGLATIGIVAILLYGYDGRPNEDRGIVLALGSGIAYATVAVSLRGLRDLDPIWLSAFNNLVGSLALGAWLAATGSPPSIPSAPQALGLIGFGVIQMAIPYALFARALRSIDAPEASLIGLIEPVLNPIWVVLVTGERPATATLVGGLFLLLGVACRCWPIGRWAVRAPAAGAQALDDNA